MKQEMERLVSAAAKNKSGKEGPPMDKEQQRKMMLLMEDLEHIKDDRDNIKARMNINQGHFYSNGS